MSYSSKYIGQRIRALRENNNISREALAEQLELSDSYIGLVERGTRGITLTNLVKIANYFEVSIEYFFLEKKGEIMHNITSTRLDHLAKIIETVDDDDYEFLLKIIKEMTVHLKNK